jgi:hypothetical protein
MLTNYPNFKTIFSAVSTGVGKSKKQAEVSITRQFRKQPEDNGKNGQISLASINEDFCKGPDYRLCFQGHTSVKSPGVLRRQLLFPVRTILQSHYQPRFESC